ncbi:ricin-type beta-trefoil lectin domain protein [Kribbella sp. NPDC023855]|uniref:RICIN domain-containing protein n=1 Tax=Kribbella sp. NPDC023855 TaxID=3154698 RepID=UPI0033E2E942
MKKVSAIRRAVGTLLVASSVVGGLSMASALPSSAAAAATPVEIKSTNSQFGLIASVSKNASNVRVTLATDNNGQLQRWRQVGSDASAGFLLEASVFTTIGQCLDVENDSTSTGAKIVIRACDGTLSQKWRYTGTRLENLYSHKYIQKPSDQEFGAILTQSTTGDLAFKKVL